MATSSLYGNSSESIGLYGIGSASGGTYFEWFIFYDSATAPATPTGGSWSFTTNTGTPPTGWLASPPPSPTNQVWVSLAIVDSRSTAALTWSTPGLMSSMGSTIANYITFVATSAPAYSSGRLWYDSTQNALSYYNDITNNTIHIGQETQLKVRNTTGATIAKGAPVYVLPTASGFGYPLVALAQADTATKANCIGLANQAIANNTDGYICINGLLTGANTGTFAVGDVLYLSPYSAGQLMNTVPPTGYAVRIGVVAFSNTPNGTIYVNESNAFVLAGNIVGTIGITNGGTGATTASGARTSLGLGTIATQDANNVAITGGSIAGITDLAIADGGTGASSAAGALANLGAVGLTDTQTLTNKTISGASNTLTNIGNSSLTNSSVTINGSGISLGGTATITAATPNNLVFGAGLSATGNFNGSVATNVTLANVGTAATYGDSGTIPVFTTNAFGQISSVSLQSVVVDSTDISGTIAVAQGGTGASSAANARVNLLPSYAGNAGEVLALNAGGTDVEWRAITGTGTVSSVAVSGGTTGLTTSGGPITAAGTITLAGTLGTANGGTNLTSFTSGGVVYASSTSALATGSVLNFNGSNLSLIEANGSGAKSILMQGGATAGDYGIISVANGSTIRGRIVADASSDVFRFDTAGGASTAYTWLIGASYTEGMRLTSAGNLGLGVTPSAWSTASSTKAFQISSVGAVIGDTATTRFRNNIYLAGSGLETYITTNFASDYAQNAGRHLWFTAASGTAGTTATMTQVMTLDASGQLALGVTSASGYRARLYGGNDNTLVIDNDGSRYTTANIANNGTTKASMYWDNTGAVFVFGPTVATSQLSFTTVNTERARFDASGNFGVGTATPASFGSGATAATVIKSAANASMLNCVGSDSTSNVGLYSGINAADNPALFYQANLRIATTTSSNGVTGFVERMRISSAGNVGINTSTFTEKFEVNGSINAIGQSTNFVTGAQRAFMDYTSGTTTARIGHISGASGSTTGVLAFYTNGTERAKIDSAGNLGLGVTPSAWALSGQKVFQVLNGSLTAYTTDEATVTGNAYHNGSGWRYIATNFAQQYSQQGGKHMWFNAPSGTAGNAITFTQAMTLDASGRLLVGITSNPVPGKVFSQDTQNPFVSWNPSTSGNNGFIDFGTEATFTERGYIYYNRAAGLVQLSATSDERLKENIVDYETALPLISSLRVRKFDWKETGNTCIGFIAQELYEVVPEAVSVGENNEDGTIKRNWGVSKEYLVPYLVKAMQEQQAIIESLKARLDAANL